MNPISATNTSSVCSRCGMKHGDWANYDSYSSNWTNSYDSYWANFGRGKSFYSRYANTQEETLTPPRVPKDSKLSGLFDSISKLNSKTGDQKRNFSDFVQQVKSFGGIVTTGLGIKELFTEVLSDFDKYDVSISYNTSYSSWFFGAVTYIIVKATRKGEGQTSPKSKRKRDDTTDSFSNKLMKDGFFNRQPTMNSPYTRSKRKFEESDSSNKRNRTDSDGTYSSDSDTPDSEQSQSQFNFKDEVDNVMKDKNTVHVSSVSKEDFQELLDWLSSPNVVVCVY
jgi:hypothetical protein